MKKTSGPESLEKNLEEMCKKRCCKKKSFASGTKNRCGMQNISLFRVGLSYFLPSTHGASNKLFLKYYREYVYRKFTHVAKVPKNAFCPI